MSCTLIAGRVSDMSPRLPVLSVGRQRVRFFVLRMGNTAFTVDDMRRFAGEAWGELGSTVVDSWCGLNAAYFDGALRPIPIVITNTQPYGRRIGLCSYG